MSYYKRDYSRCPDAERIQNELEKTAILSDEFKGWLNGWLFSAVNEAYKAGVEDAKDKKKLAKSRYPAKTLE